MSQQAQRAVLIDFAKVEQRTIAYALEKHPRDLEMLWKLQCQIVLRFRGDPKRSACKAVMNMRVWGASWHKCRIRYQEIMRNEQQ